MFGNNITIQRNVIIWGNVSFNNLSKEKGVEILGDERTPLLLPVIDPLPSIAPFPIDTDDVLIKAGANATIEPGNYRVIDVGSKSVATFTGGIYNANELRIGSNSTVIFTTPSVVNIEQLLRIGSSSTVRDEASIRGSGSLINFAGNQEVLVGNKTILFVHLVSLHAIVNLGSEGEYSGTFTAKILKVGAQSVVRWRVIQIISDFTAYNQTVDIIFSEGLNLQNTLTALNSDH